MCSAPDYGARRFLSFFFFQAEDGIRDLTVTGVQTCALPISAFSRAAQSMALPAAFSPCCPGCGTHRPMRSEERRVGKSVDLGGRRIIKKKKNRNHETKEIVTMSEYFE